MVAFRPACCKDQRADRLLELGDSWQQLCAEVVSPLLGGGAYQPDAMDCGGRLVEVCQRATPPPIRGVPQGNALSKPSLPTVGLWLAFGN